MRYATTSKPTPETQDIWDAYRSSRAATVMYGPLVLAKAKRLGLKGNEIFAAETINGKGYSVRLKTLPAQETLGAWEVELYKPGEKTIRTKACDYQSAADEALPPGSAVFSTWF